MFFRVTDVRISASVRPMTQQFAQFWYYFYPRHMADGGSSRF
ncbi:hypothetical protein CLV89_11749 [Tritonibacter scottomollicae]|uniref:Uncharacterized protein n=1 Tax=Tritonibacter scottomollicae TaxID=483013 RepID=A0A2T1A9K9_TRISK|nr:hypothetical protein CLV89_11749 [Tritonibacter scottomollicae]